VTSFRTCSTKPRTKRDQQQQSERVDPYLEIQIERKAADKSHEAYEHRAQNRAEDGRKLVHFTPKGMRRPAREQKENGDRQGKSYSDRDLRRKFRQNTDREQNQRIPQDRSHACCGA
jgi:hypothetical protein